MPNIAPSITTSETLSAIIPPRDKENKTPNTITPNNNTSPANWVSLLAFVD